MLEFHQCLNEKIGLNLFGSFSDANHVTIVNVSVHTNGVGPSARNIEQKTEFHSTNFLEMLEIGCGKSAFITP